MKAFPTIHRFLHIGLASHLRHIDTIEDLLPHSAMLLDTPLFTNPLVLELKEVHGWPEIDDQGPPILLHRDDHSRVSLAQRLIHEDYHKQTY